MADTKKTTEPETVIEVGVDTFKRFLQKDGELGGAMKASVAAQQALRQIRNELAQMQEMLLGLKDVTNPMQIVSIEVRKGKFCIVLQPAKKPE